MTDLEGRRPPPVGAYWINEEDYPALLRIFADGNTMPRTWREWLKIAEEMENGLKAYGHVVMRVRIDPNTFPDWCAVHGTNRAAKDAKSLSVPLSSRDTAIKTDELSASGHYRNRR